MIDKDLTIKLYQSVKEARKPREINHWHASSIAKCPRALYFERKGVTQLPDNEPGAGKILRWEAGHHIETTIRQHLRNVYPNLLTNVRFTTEALDLTGEFDAYDHTSKTLISVKSVHDYAMITRNGEVGLKERIGLNDSGKVVYELKEGPYLHHEWQEHAYVLLAASSDEYPLGQEIDHIAYIYITLGGLMASYTTDIKPEILERVKKKVDYLNECWKSETIPLCLCQEGQEMYQVQDQYCPYRDGAKCCSESLLILKEATEVRDELLGNIEADEDAS